jgi:hypothetical protein
MGPMAVFKVEDVEVRCGDWQQAQARLREWRKAHKGAEKRVRVTGRFLKGPVPMAWIAAADEAGALMVGMCLWYLRGLNKAETFKVSNAALAPWGVNRERKARGLRKLAEAGLITLETRPNASPMVTVLQYPAGGPSYGAGGPF